MGRPKGSKNGQITIRTKECVQCCKTFSPSYANYHRVRFCSLKCNFASGRKSGRLGKTGSQKQKEVMKSRTGEKHPRYIKDRTLIKGRHSRGMHDPDYKNWRKSVNY